MNDQQEPPELPESIPAYYPEKQFTRSDIPILIGLALVSIGWMVIIASLAVEISRRM